MDDYNVPVLVDAKSEYTQQLVNTLKPHLFNGIHSIYQDCDSIVNENNNRLMAFQELLGRIPQWSQEMIERETNRIIECSNCDWLEDLITAVFVSHTKILTAIRVGKKHKKINLKVPKVDHFIHKVYIEIAREFWKNPYLLQNIENKCDYQKNLNICEKLVEESLIKTIRSQLPVKHILQEYLGENYQEDFEEDFSDDDKKDDSDSEEEETKSKKNKTKNSDRNLEDDNSKENTEITNEDTEITNEDTTENSKEKITKEEKLEDEGDDNKEEVEKSKTNSNMDVNVEDKEDDKDMELEEDMGSTKEIQKTEKIEQELDTDTKEEEELNLSSVLKDKEEVLEKKEETEKKEEIVDKEINTKEFSENSDLVEDKTIKQSSTEDQIKKNDDEVDINKLSIENVSVDKDDYDLLQEDLTGGSLLSKNTEPVNTTTNLENENNILQSSNQDLDLLSNVGNLETVSLDYDLPEVNTEVENELQSINSSNSDNSIKEITIPDVPVNNSKPSLFEDAAEDFI